MKDNEGHEFVLLEAVEIIQRGMTNCATSATCPRESPVCPLHLTRTWALAHRAHVDMQHFFFAIAVLQPKVHDMKSSL
jgi:hypothetical protein